MRALLSFVLLTALAGLAGLLALLAVPEPAQPLPPRSGLDLASATNWGYQLQYVKPQLIPDAVDVLVVDYSRDGSAYRAFSRAQVEALRQRAGGRRRVVLCYLSIGEAESYRYYWKYSWNGRPPAWLGAENAAWKGNFDVQFWSPEWQRVILDPRPAPKSMFERIAAVLFAPDKGYIDHIIEAGFDGVYLDRIDAYEKAYAARPSARADMIAFVTAISRYAKVRRPGFLIVPQNGEELLTDAGYRRVIDGVGKEDLLFGEKGDGVPNAPDDSRHATALLDRVRAEGRPVFVVEYLSDSARQLAAARSLRELGFVPLFAERGLKLPPVPVAAPPEGEIPARVAH
jgi:cysteinyl-tRNA synthetase, unknown class